MDDLSAVSPQQIMGKKKLDLPPGNDVLNVTVDIAVLNDKTAPQLGGNFPGRNSNMESHGRLFLFRRSPRG